MMFDSFFDVYDLALIEHQTMKKSLTHFTHLFDKPMDLSFRPFLLVSRIYHDIFSLMLQRVINLTTDNSVAAPAASLGIHDYVRTNFLSPIHDQAMNDSELAASGLMTKDRTLINSMLTVLLPPKSSYPGH